MGLLVLDFDQTLCSSKSGNPPAADVHRIDAELARLIASKQVGRVVVATRNSHRQQILAFLEAKRALVGIAAVVCVNVEGSSKAAVVQEWLSVLESEAAAAQASGATSCAETSEARCVMVDDDLAELISEPALVDDPRVLRVWFGPQWEDRGV